MTSRRTLRAGLASAIMLTIALGTATASAQELSAQDNLIIEALMRLESYDYASAKPKVKEAVGRYLKVKWGTAEALDLIERFQIRDKDDALLALALEKPTDTLGVRCAKLLIKAGEASGFEKVIAAQDAKARDAALNVLGFTGEPAAVDLLAAMAVDPKRPLPVRGSAVRALAHARAGEKKIIALAQAGQLPQELHVTAAGALATTADPEIRAAAAKHLKTPAGAGGKPLPPIHVLAKRQGDAAKGKAVYQKVCFACHKVGDFGLDFGPPLTEIGDKLPREGLLQAILEPSAGISFGYEAFVIKLSNDSELMGFIASETEDQITLKMAGGIAQIVDKRQIAARRQLPTSLMPPGLQAAMSEQDLIDLVEFLTTLKKVGDKKQ